MQNSSPYWHQKFNQSICRLFYINYLMVKRQKSEGVNYRGSTKDKKLTFLTFVNQCEINKQVQIMLLKFKYELCKLSAKFSRCHARFVLEELGEERGVGKVHALGNFPDGDVAVS